MQNASQLDMLHQLQTTLEPNPAVRALLVVGSVARGTYDRWSDLDVVIVVADDQFAMFDPATQCFGVLGDVLAFEHSSLPGRSTTRAWFATSRIDLVVTTESVFSQEGDWPIWNGLAVCFSRSPLVDHVVDAFHVPPPAKLLAQDDFEALVNRFWFQAVMALAKVMRDDLLIGLHLCLEAVQTASVLGMALRDRATGRTIHASGGMGNAVAAQLRLPQGTPTAASIIDCLEHSGRMFDQLATEWSPDYRRRFETFTHWLDDARAALREPTC